MTASESLPPIDDELLSAYLDDELSDDERRRVETRLAADPAARQLLEALRSLSTTLERLPDEFPDPGLQEAIHTRLTAAQPTLQSADRSEQGGGGLRRWAWAAMAIAAAVMLVLFVPEEKPAELAGVDRQNERDEGPGDPAPRDADSNAGVADGPIVLESAPAEMPPSAARDVADRTQQETGEAGGFGFVAEADGGADALGGLAADSFDSESMAAGGDAGAIPVVELTFTSRRANFADFQRALANNEVELRPAEGPSSAQQSAVEQQLRYSRGRALDSTAEEVVLVEATPDQIDHLLQEVYRDRATYRAVAIQGSPLGGRGGRSDGTRADDWRQYARGGDDHYPATENLSRDPTERPAIASDQPESITLQPAQRQVAAASAKEGASQRKPGPQGWAMRFPSARSEQAGLAEEELTPFELQSAAPIIEAPAERIQVLFLLQGGNDP